MIKFCPTCNSFATDEDDSIIVGALGHHPACQLSLVKFATTEDKKRYALILGKLLGVKLTVAQFGELAKILFDFTTAHNLWEQVEKETGEL